jgi:hypothetical protein
MKTPPGIVYIAQHAPFLLIPPALVYAISVAISIHLGIELPKWIIVIAPLLSLPLNFLITILYTDYINGREAAAFGATFPPSVESKLPFGLSTLRTVVTNFKNGYSGESTEFALRGSLWLNEPIGGIPVQWFKRYGHTFNVRVLCENKVYLKSGRARFA